MDFISNPVYEGVGKYSSYTATGLDDNALYLFNGYNVTITKGTVLCTIPDRVVYQYSVTWDTSTQYIVRPVNGEISYTKAGDGGVGGYCKLTN